MNSLTTKSCLVWDHGLFAELAVTLAPHFGRVWYHTPVGGGTPTPADWLYGKGIPNVVRTDRPFDLLDEVDLWVFPDVFHSDLQLMLEKAGKRVWGSRAAQGLELSRMEFKEWQQEHNLPVPKHSWVRGIEPLKELLAGMDEGFVKISSRFRGLTETWRHHDPEQTERHLEHLAADLGPAKYDLWFCVESPVPADSETGLDTYIVDGQIPDTVCQGYEIKDEGIISAVQPYRELPKSIRQTVDPLAEKLKEDRMRNFLSLEVRASGDTGYCLEPTTRAPSPGLGVHLQLIENLADVIWQGSTGKLVQPKMRAKFGIECAIHHEGRPQDWRSVTLQPGVRDQIKLMDFMQVGDTYHFIPKCSNTTKIGWAVGVGDSLEACIENVCRTAEQLKECGLRVNTKAMVDAIKEIQKAESDGVPFTKKTVPEPETVLNHE